MKGYFNPIPRKVEPEYKSVPTFVSCQCGNYWNEDIVRDINAQMVHNGPYVRYDYCDKCKDKPSLFNTYPMSKNETQRD